MMEAICTSQMSVYFNKTTRRYVSEGCHLHTLHHEDVKSHSVNKNLPIMDYRLYALAINQEDRWLTTEAG
jgi:hypothetical protein